MAVHLQPRDVPQASINEKTSQMRELGGLNWEESKSSIELNRSCLLTSMGRPVLLYFIDPKARREHFDLASQAHW